MAQPFVRNRMFGSLQEAYDRLEAIVNCSHDGIYITDGQANTLWVNPSYLSISGLQKEDDDPSAGCFYGYRVMRNL